MATSREIHDIARALIEETMHEDSVPRVVTDLLAVADAVKIHPEILSALTDQSVKQEVRRSALHEALGKQVHPFILNALLVLLDRDQLDELTAFVSSVVGSAEKLAKHREVTVRSALPLIEKERTELEKAIKARFGGTVALRESVDHTILGGLIVDIGDWHVDASVRGKLERLKTIMYGRGYPAPTEYART